MPGFSPPPSLGVTLGSSGDAHAVKGFTSDNGFVMSAGNASLGGPQFHSDGSGNVYVETFGAQTIFLRPGGNGSNVGLITMSTTTLGFFGAAAVAKQNITGALSTVADAAAKAVLTSIIAALANYGLATNGTT